MNLDVSLWAALSAGFVSFLAPCVLPLVPGYLAWLAGVSLADQDRVRPRLVITAVAFVLGFSTIFILLGATASFAGRFVANQMGVLSVIAGTVIIVFGLNMLGVLRIGLLAREARIEGLRKAPGLGGAYLMGLAFGFGWTPCAGPVLSVILIMAGAEAQAMRGAVLLAAYSAGLGVPFVLAALFAGAFARASQRFRPILPWLEKATGALLVLTGVLFITGTINRIGFWLYEALPGLGGVG